MDACRSVIRKHISWKTKYASALLALGHIPYSDAKQMTEDQIISLYHLDHAILHENEHEDRDKFWNLTPMLIQEHRAKTRADMKIIAKGRRIRRKEHMLEINREMREFVRENPEAALAEAFIEGTFDGRLEANASWVKEANRPGGIIGWKKRIRSRGFDKTLKRKLDGKVVPR